METEVSRKEHVPKVKRDSHSRMSTLASDLYVYICIEREREREMWHGHKWSSRDSRQKR
jgi:hypothetical protein